MLFRQKYVVYLCKSQFSSILCGYLNRQSIQFINAKQKYDEILLDINRVRKIFDEGGGERAKVRHVQQNKKVLADDRLKLLFDDGKYSELYYFTGYGQHYGDIPRAGSITAIGKINKHLCSVVATDPTVKGGAVFPIQLRKQLRTVDITMKLRLPFIYIVDSGGAFLHLQSEIFPDKNHGGRIFYCQAVMQSQGIPLMSLVCGNCTAGAAYIPTMCSEMGMVHKTSCVFLGGPALVKAATGEIVDAEELGGALMHASVSGCSDHTYLTEFEGLESIRNMVMTLPTHTMNCTNKINPVDPLFPSEDLNGLLINNALDYDQRRATLIQILARLLDGSTMHEFKSQFGLGLITGFGRISGYMVGILAGYNSLSESDCLKGCHFVQNCQLRNVPIISFVHTVQEPHSALQTSHSFGGLIKARSSFIRSMSTRNIKLITVVIGDAIGIDYICLGSDSMEPDFSFAWPNAEFRCSLSGLEEEESTSVLNAAGNMVIDDIIEPVQTRMIITNYLDILHTETNLLQRMNTQAVYRF